MRKKLALIFFVGLALNTLVLFVYVQSGDDTHSFDGLGIWLAVAHGVGGALAAYWLAGAFGRKSVAGWLVSLFATITIILLAAIVGGLMVGVQGMITAGDDFLVAGIRTGTAILALPVSMANIPGLWLTPLILWIVAQFVAARDKAAEGV